MDAILSSSLQSRHVNVYSNVLIKEILPQAQVSNGFKMIVTITMEINITYDGTTFLSKADQQDAETKAIYTTGWGGSQLAML